MSQISKETDIEEPFIKLVSKVRKEVYSMECRNGSKPTFEEYVKELIDKGDVSIDKLREGLRALALAWSGAKLGKSNWKELYNKISIEASNTNFNSYGNTPIKKQKDNIMKTNKILTFFKSLGKELDEEIIKGIQSVGIVKLILGVAGFLLLRFLVSYFGSDGSVFTFYFISGIGLLIFLSWYVSELKEKSKMFSIFRYGILILGTVVSTILILALIYGIIQYIIDAVKYLYHLLF